MSVKRTFPEYRFPNEFPNEITPEIRVISGACYVFVKRTFFEQYDNLLLHSHDFLINAPAHNLNHLRRFQCLNKIECAGPFNSKKLLYIMRCHFVVFVKIVNIHFRQVNKVNIR